MSRPPTNILMIVAACVKLRFQTSVKYVTITSRTYMAKVSAQFTAVEKKMVLCKHRSKYNYCLIKPITKHSEEGWHDDIWFLQFKD